MLRTSMDWLFRSSDGPPKPTEALGTATEKGKRSCKQPSNATPMQPNIGSSCSKLMFQSAAPPRSWPFLKVGQFWQTNLSGWRTSRKTKANSAASFLAAVRSLVNFSRMEGSFGIPNFKGRSFLLPVPQLPETPVPPGTRTLPPFQTGAHFLPRFPVREFGFDLRWALPKRGRAA